MADYLLSLPPENSSNTTNQNIAHAHVLELSNMDLLHFHNHPYLYYKQD